MGAGLDVDLGDDSVLLHSRHQSREGVSCGGLARLGFVGQRLGEGSQIRTGHAAPAGRSGNGLESAGVGPAPHGVWTHTEQSSCVAQGVLRSVAHLRKNRPRNAVDAAWVRSFTRVSGGGDPERRRWPLCGMTAHRSFGARTGGAPFIMGSVLLVLALALGSGLAGVLSNFPVSVLAGLLAVAGLLHLALSRDLRARGDWVVAVIVGVLGVVGQLALGLVIGLVLAWVFGRLDRTVDAPRRS